MIKWNEVTWYSRLGALILFLGVVPALCFYIGIQYEITVAQPLLSAENVYNNTISKKISVPEDYVPLDTSEFFKEDKRGFSESGITSPQSGSVVSFKLTEGTQGQNGSFYVLLNGKQIGETSGLLMTFEGFSPDGNYFVFETHGTCGVACEEFETDVIDAKNSKIEYLKTGKAFISSYEWDKNKLYLTEYSYNLDTYPQSYRTSPKQVWMYDPQTEQYNFVRNLPESPLQASAPKPVLAGIVDTIKTPSSGAGDYIAVSKSDEQGDAAIYLQNAAGTSFTPAYCGLYDSWAASGDKIKVFVPSECPPGNQTSYFYLYTDGSVGPVEGSTYVPKVQ